MEDEIELVHGFAVCVSCGHTWVCCVQLGETPECPVCHEKGELRGSS